MTRAELLDYLRTIPAVDTHVHMGSLPAFGESPSGFVSDISPGPYRGVSGLEDLLRSVYLGGLLNSVAPGRKLAAGLEELGDCGPVRTLDTALEELYGRGLAAVPDPEEYRAVSRQVEANYRNFFGWGGEVLGRSGVASYLKPVRTEYLEGIAKQPVRELSGIDCHPILRIEDLISRADPSITLDELENRIRRAFELVDTLGIRSLKHALAYRRPLAISAVERAEALAAPGTRREEDYLLQIIFSEAADRGLAFQIHTGMADLDDSRPAQLEALIRRYPALKFVLLHTYPFHAEAAVLARGYSNVYLDAAWLAILSPALLGRVLSDWIGFVPLSRIMLSSDATFPEELYGAWSIMRERLATTLIDLISAGAVAPQSVERCAFDLLRGNALRLYGLAGSPHPNSSRS